MLNYLLIVILLCFSAFFSASEISFASSNEMRLKHKSEEHGSLAARLAYKIYCIYESALATILIGNNLVNIAASSVATVIAVELLGQSRAWVSAAAITVLLLIFGEITPKAVAKAMPEKASTAFAIPLYIFMLITKPVVIIVDLILKAVSAIWKSRMNTSPAVTEDELETIIDTVEDEGVIDEEKCDLIQSVFDFDDVQAYEIITPRVDTLAIDIDDEREKITDKVLMSTFSRLPVYRDTIDNIIGIVHINSVLKDLAENDSFDIEKHIKPAVFVHKTMPVDDVLKQMQAKKSHMAIVTDEYGGVMGILTMEDIIEQLVGDIWDESDVIDPELIELKDDEYEISADMRIEDMFDELDFDYKDFDDDNATVGGFVTEILGRYARKGDVAEYENLVFTVLRVKKRRIIKLKVKILPLPEEEQEDDN